MEKLTKAEEEIMQQIWEHAPCTVSQLIEQMPEPKPPHSTVSSVFRILERKGFLDHKAYGRTYEYFPIIEKADYADANVEDMLENYYEGSVQRLVSSLLKREQLDEAEIEELKKLLE